MMKSSFLSSRVHSSRSTISVLQLSLKCLIYIIHISNATAHACCKISAGIAKDDNPATGHVFTTMITHSFYYHIGT